MKSLKSEFPIALALLILGLGAALEHGAVEHGGLMLWGLLFVVLAAIIGVPWQRPAQADPSRAGGALGQHGNPDRATRRQK